MIKTSHHRFALHMIVLLPALALILFPALTEAKAKAKGGKAAKAKVTEKADADKADADKADSTAAETDTDADEIFTEDEIKKDGSETGKAEETAPNAAEAEKEEAEPSGQAASDNEASDNTAAATSEGAETDTDAAPAETTVEVLSSSDEKKGFFPTEFDGPDMVRRDRGINILTARAARPMSLTLVIDHRPYVGLGDGKAKDVFFDYLGLDGGYLKIGLGLRFGIIEGLDVGLYRLNDGGTVAFDTYEFDARYAFLKQEKFFVDMSVRAGLSWFAQENAQDAVGGYGELFIDHIFLDMLLVGVGFQFHSESTNDMKFDSDTSYSGAILGVIEWRLIKQLALTAEIAACVVGYGSDYGNAKIPSFPSFSMGVKVLTHRHTFTLLVSNTQFINADGIVSNSWRDFSDIIFGFQIFREFNFK